MPVVGAVRNDEGVVRMPMSGSPEPSPAWLRPLVDNLDGVPKAYRSRVPLDVLAAITAASATASLTGNRRDAAVLVLFSGAPDAGPDGGPPADADLLVIVRASTLRHHAGQAAFPGGAADPEDADAVATALREAAEETGLDTSRLRTFATLDKVFIPPSNFHVVPVLAYSADPGPVTVMDPAETAVVDRVPLRAFVNPENRLMVYRANGSKRMAGPAFLLNRMLVWGFTAQVISAMLDAAGWARPWDSKRVMELDDAMALVGGEDLTR